MIAPFWIGVATVSARWLMWMIQMSWQVAILAVIIWLISRLLFRTPAALRYFLWFLLFVKLVLPPNLGSPWSVGNLWFAMPEQNPVASLSGNEPRWPASDSVPPLTESAMLATRFSDISVSPLAPDHRPLILMGIWFVVAGGLFAALLWQCRTYTLRIIHSATAAPALVQQVLARQLKIQGIRRSVRINVSDAVTTPGVFGAFRPLILLPAQWEDRFSKRELSCVLAHELAHVKRGDLFLSWIVSFLACLYWFHPVVWIAGLYLRREREMACDDAALLSTGSTGRDYASTILRVAESFTGQVPAGVGLLGLLELSDDLLHRIRSAGDAQRRRRPSTPTWIVILLVASLLPMGPWNITEANTPNSTSVPPTVATNATPPAQAIAEKQEEAPSTVATSTPPKAQPPSMALIDVAGEGSDILAQPAAQLQELLTEQLANKSGIHLVERNQLESALSEIGLATSGLVDTNNAARIGKLSGARFLITVRLMQLDGQWTATARLLNVETSTVAAVKASAPDTVSMESVAEQLSDAIAMKSVDFPTSSTPVDKGNAELQTLRRELANRSLPHVVVLIPECHGETWISDSTSENAVMDVLAKAGFTVIDVSSLMKREPSSWWLSIFRGHSKEKEGDEIVIRQGLRSVSDILHDARIDKIKANADLLVIGQAFSERAGERNGFKSCRARLEIKALDTVREQVAATLSEEGAAVDTAEHMAGKAALQSTGTRLGIALARNLADYWTGRGQR